MMWSGWNAKSTARLTVIGRLGAACAAVAGTVDAATDATAGVVAAAAGGGFAAGGGAVSRRTDA